MGKRRKNAVINEEASQFVQEVIQYATELDRERLLKNIEKIRQLADEWEQIAKNSQNDTVLRACMLSAGFVANGLEKQKEQYQLISQERNVKLSELEQD